jgi:hypothetical protein
MANEHGRNIADALLIVTKALPAATATNVSDSIDLGTTGYKPENVEVEISVPAMPLHVTANNTTLTLHDSADNSSFAEVDPLTQTKILGVVTVGSSAKTVRFRLPPNVRRYIAFSQTAGATDTLTSYTITYKLLF